MHLLFCNGKQLEDSQEKSAKLVCGSCVYRTCDYRMCDYRTFYLVKSEHVITLNTLERSGSPPVWISNSNASQKKQASPSTDLCVID